MPVKIAVVSILLWVALLTGLMPPGVCPCWLMPDPAHQHPHPGGHSDQPHSHDYLLDLFESQTVPGLTAMPISVAFWLAVLAASGLVLYLSQPGLCLYSWNCPVEPPPPR
jgi:hypothetical protein